MKVSVAGMGAGTRLLAGVCAVMAFGGALATGHTQRPDPAPSAEEIGPAQRLGKRIDGAAAETWNWVTRQAERTGERAAAAGRCVGGWWEDGRAAVWGEQSTRRPAEVFLAVSVPAGPRDPSRPGSNLPFVWQRLGGDVSAVVRGGGATSPVLPSRLVLLVHGLDEPGGMWDDLAPALYAKGLPIAKFDYPNDQPIAESTDMLAGVMRGLRARGVVRVDMVAHSMGGLVTRDLLTRPAYYNADAAGGASFPHVQRLVVLSAPYAGSILAPLQCIAEAREHLTRLCTGLDRRGDGWLNSYADGNGEAGRDLTPGSAFLKDLDSRPDPTGVKITNVVATIVPPSCEDEAAAFADAVKYKVGLGDDGAWGRALAGALGYLGDGMVCRDSAAWECAHDTVRIAADHRGMVQRWGWLDAIDPECRHHAKEPRAIPIIVDRLTRE